LDKTKKIGDYGVLFRNRVLPKTLSLEDSLMLNKLPNNLRSGVYTNSLVVEYGSVHLRNR
jgi:hypothetical protein